MRRWTTSSHPARTTRTHRLAIATASTLAVAGITAGTMAGVVSTAHAADQVPTATSAREAIPALATKQAAAAVHLQSARSAIAAANAEQIARAATIRTAVVTKAMAQVGDAYVAGAEGPNAFDCSGLVKYAWKTAGGVTLEHYSYAQFKETQRVSVKNAVPGDLAFYFKNGAHHVGIYIGDGKIVNASDYGIGVIVSPLLSGWGKDHFSGMGRVTIPS